MKPLGPNVRRLIAHKTSLLAIPPGVTNGLMAGLEAIISGKIVDHAREAAAWVNQAIAAVKAAPDNPYGDDDEAIAGEIIRQIDERTRQQRMEARQ